MHLLQLRAHVAQIGFPLAFKKALHRAIAGQIPTIRSVIKYAVLFLFKFTAIEIVEKQIAPKIETIRWQRKGFAF